MNYIRVSNNGRITVPIKIRQALQIETGDYLVFHQKDNGEIIVVNPRISAVREPQTAIADSEHSEKED